MRAPFKRGNDPVMDLPEGKTCGDCTHFQRCQMFGRIPEDEVCDWAPTRLFKEVVKNE